MMESPLRKQGAFSMRLLFVHQNFPGQYKHLAPAFANEPGNQVVCVGETDNIARAAGMHPKVQLIPYAKPEGAGKQTHHYLRGMEAAVRRGQAVARVALDLRKRGFRPDVICAHPGWGEALFLKDVFPEAKLQVYLEFYYRAHGSDMNFDPEFPSNFDDQFRVRIRNGTQLLSLEAADAAISPTEWQRSQFPALMRDRIDVIHDGVDTAAIAAHGQSGAVTFAIPGADRVLRAGDEVVTYVARNLEPYRGFHSFMRALPMILNARPEAQVVIVGGDEVSYGRTLPDGETYRQRMMKEVGDKLDLKRVHFTGKLPYVKYLDLLRLSSVHVYLTYPFVLSWSLIEAMASACCLVASRTPPVQEVIVDGRNGRLVDFFSPQEIADTVIATLRHPESCRQMRAQARVDACERFDLRTVTLPRLMDNIRALAG